MGALHEGHLSLARSQNDKVVASIFVNPAQFAPHEDLSKYPRTVERDIEMLGKEGVDAVFLPSVEEMYPAGIVLDVKDQQGTFVEVKGKSHQMEGQIRPHFFRGVATIVTKLFNITLPTRAYFGQKDAQQCAVIRSMVRDLWMPLSIIVAPTIRESDGLAMSSRNVYLSPSEREAAPILYKALSEGVNLFQSGERRRSELISAVEEVVKGEERVQLEYLSLADPFLLGEVDVVQDGVGAIFSGAVKVGKTRIIDNVLLGIGREQWVE
ncbi:pantothenate synthase [Rhizophlyctis rosea]|uniref:Pantoate--beta-alanine ligase n=1 Tax=Rhizophlyctis rosea TaxID=64517 RepID=A0AAD5SCG7_9FUNG|nr:pantothenate synthase [Rhizophlyctis rosea]